MNLRIFLDFPAAATGARTERERADGLLTTTVGGTRTTHRAGLSPSFGMRRRRPMRCAHSSRDGLSRIRFASAAVRHSRHRKCARSSPRLSRAARSAPSSRAASRAAGNGSVDGAGMLRTRSRDRRARGRTDRTRSATFCRSHRTTATAPPLHSPAHRRSRREMRAVLAKRLRRRAFSPLHPHGRQRPRRQRLRARARR